jgi:hypothetical protein
MTSALIVCGRDADRREARDVVNSLDAAPDHDGYALNEMVSLILHALLSAVEGDEIAYRDFAERLRLRATSLDAVGFIALADAMT